MTKAKKTVTSARERRKTIEAFDAMLEILLMSREFATWAQDAARDDPETSILAEDARARIDKAIADVRQDLWDYLSANPEPKTDKKDADNGPKT